MVRKIFVGVLAVLLCASTAYATPERSVGGGAGFLMDATGSTGGGGGYLEDVPVRTGGGAGYLERDTGKARHSAPGWMPSIKSCRKWGKENRMMKGFDGFDQQVLTTFLTGLSTALADFTSSFGDNDFPANNFTSVFKTFAETLGNLFSTFKEGLSAEKPAKWGRGNAVVDVTITDGAKEDCNVRAARVVERGDTVYGVVKYGRPRRGADTDGHGWPGPGHAHGRGHHNFGRTAKVEFTGIAAEDIESVTLDSVDGKLQFKVTKTDGTVVTFDVPDKNKPAADGDDTPDGGQTDFTDYTDSASLISEAWSKLDKGNYNTAIEFAQETINRHATQAAEQQASLSGFASSDDAADYWALNDVGTAYFIMGKSSVKQEKIAKAKEAFQKIISDYGYAQCWDTQGWWWKVAEGAQEELDKL